MKIAVYGNQFECIVEAERIAYDSEAGLILLLNGREDDDEQLVGIVPITHTVVSVDD